MPTPHAAKRLLLVFLLLVLGVSACHRKEPPKPIDPDAGKHLLGDSDPRSWYTYPALLLIAARHHVGVDTVTALTVEFNKRFGGDDTDLTFKAQLPRDSQLYEEDAPTTAAD